MGITTDYFIYYDKYRKLYGEKTIPLMMVGSFYECYSTNTQGPNLFKISELLNIICTRKDKSNNIIDENNCYLLGFPCVAKNKYIKLLIDNCFHVIIIDQITPPPNPKRDVTAIYSYGTYIDNIHLPDFNYIVSLYIEEESQINSKSIMCIGMSAIDLTIGKCYIHEAISTPYDDKYALDSAALFIQTYNPKEILINQFINEKEKKTITKEFIISYLEIENKMYQYNTMGRTSHCGSPIGAHTKINKHYNKISYQNEFFGTVYKNTGMLSPIEYLDIEKMQYCSISFIILLNYCHQHSENILNNICKPIQFNNEKYLKLENNVIQQLNLIESNLYDTSNIKFKSLFNVVNQTTTSVGKRFLQARLLSPLIDGNELNKIYDNVDELIKNEDIINTIEINNKIKRNY